MLNYPNKKATYKTPKTSQSRRGMTLEKTINNTNKYYLSNGLAVIHKKPTPIQVVKVDYPERSRAKITDAFFTTPSTTDYNGVYRGCYIDFDAKECANKTSFPLSSIHEHQFEHLHDCYKHGGIGFILFHFKVQDRYFILDIECLYQYYTDSKNGGRKSIPFITFETIGIEIRKGYKPRLDYLKALDVLIDLKLKSTR